MGLSPTTPQNAAGCRMEPPVSVPSESETSRAATDAAEPPEEPPVTRWVFQGLLGCGWKALDSLEEP